MAQQLSRADLNRLVRMLVNAGAVRIYTEPPVGDKRQPNEFFALKSGRKSPYYVNAREVIDDGDNLHVIAEMLCAVAPHCRRFIGPPYAAIPLAVACAMKRAETSMDPIAFLYWRKEEKAHGLDVKIEGRYEPGDTVVIVEDVATTGGSTLEAVQLAREAGMVVTDAVVIVDREEGATAALAAVGVTLHSLLPARTLTDLMVESGKWTVPEADAVRDYLESAAA